jgi:hypothetical protein
MINQCRREPTVATVLDPMHKDKRLFLPLFIEGKNFKTHTKLSIAVTAFVTYCEQLIQSQRLGSLVFVAGFSIFGDRD